MKNKYHFLILILPFLFLSKSNLGQIPDLKTVGQFALFTSSGAFTNIGTSTITGSIGTNLGAITGFPPGILIGESHVADPVSAQAVIDLGEANSFLSGLSCDSIINDTMGNGQILYPGVYCVDIASILIGNLILDGQGSPDAAFVFKINGALSTSTFANISLVNSAALKNVFWQINGAFELKDSSVFKGNVITNGAISLLESSYFFGKGLSIAGAISLQSNIVDTIATLSNVNPLPIELISFEGIYLNENVLLTWSTASETNNNYFSIERSPNGMTWEILNEIKGAGNSFTSRDYSFSDTHPLATISYYRLKQTDYDGKYKYSFIIAVETNNSSSNELLVYPNPTKGLLNLQFEDSNKINSLKLFNSFGEKVYSSNEVNYSIDLSKMEKGIYYLQVQSVIKMINKKIVIED